MIQIYRYSFYKIDHGLHSKENLCTVQYCIEARRAWVLTPGDQEGTAWNQNGTAWNQNGTKRGKLNDKSLKGSKPWSDLWAKGQK